MSKSKELAVITCDTAIANTVPTVSRQQIEDTLDQMEQARRLWEAAESYSPGILRRYTWRLFDGFGW